MGSPGYRLCHIHKAFHVQISVIVVVMVMHRFCTSLINGEIRNVKLFESDFEFLDVEKLQIWWYVIV